MFSNVCPFRVFCSHDCMVKDKNFFTGECEGSERSCEAYEACIDGECKCPECDLTPDTVCAHPLGQEGSRMNFTSICAMRQYACEQQVVYVLLGQGPCSPPGKI